MEPTAGQTGTFRIYHFIGPGNYDINDFKSQGGNLSKVLSKCCHMDGDLNSSVPQSKFRKIINYNPPVIKCDVILACPWLELKSYIICHCTC